LSGSDVDVATTTENGRVTSSPVSDAPTEPSTPPVADSRSFRRAFQDLRDGFKHRELWLHLGWQDIKQRYRRSVLGPFWITIATGVSAVAMGLLYGTLFDMDIAEFLPYVTLGFIIWNLISGSILEGADVFMSNEGLIKQLPTPLSVHVYRLVWRQMILFAHNIVIYVVIFAIFPQPISWTAIAAVPALFLIAINAVWVSLLFGILATRYRDIAPLLGSIVQLLFFMTPIIWTEKTLEGTGNEGRAKIAEINPLYHFLDIVRTPLLGGDQQLYHWVIVLAVTVVGWAVALFAMRNYRARVAYWV
jgi:ABC-2 type transport system permease protein